MSLTCPRCGRTLQFSGEPPSFCAYCGSALGLPRTAVFDPEAETVAPREPGPDGSAAAPAQVGGYRLLRPLGAGGMGSVYEAEDAASGRRVALKLIPPEYATPAAVERFRQEGRLASGIAHPRCVFVLAADEEAGRPYIVMELMPGDTLEALVERQGPLPPEEAVARILDVIDGLREAHRLGVIHRDVKPSNCFLEADGRVKVGDFGLAKSLVNQTHLTKTGSFLGTVLYCSPEQVRAEAVDQQSDVYSVAATLYFLLTGRAPFQTGDAAATLARIVADPAPPMRTVRRDVPAALDQVVLRGLERDRQRRWRNLDDFREALLPFAPGRLSIGGVGLRFGAFLVDTLIQLPVGVPPTLLFMQATAEPGYLAAARVASALYLLVHFLYFAVPEGLWGWTPGKRLLRLRVWTAAGSDPPGLARAFLRTGIWLALVTLPHEAFVFFVDPYQVSQNQVLNTLVSGSEVVTNLLGIGLLVSTMRVRNGYRCLHDVLTGTRVVHLPEPERRRSLPQRRLDERLAPADGAPPRLGGFVVRGTLGRGRDGEVLLGEDPALGRPVLLWLRPAGAPPLDAARRDTARATRLRWLAGGEHDGRPWDAFLAPAGCSLPDLVAARGKLPWVETRPALEQLADELAAACAEGTLPHTLATGQVWVQANGQVVLLDTPLDGAPADAAPGEGLAAEDRALGLLGRVAVLALEGRPRPVEAPPAPVRAPVPVHARRFLGRLVGVPRPFESVKQVQAELAATRRQPTEVTRPRRASHLALLLAFLWLTTGLPTLLMGTNLLAFMVPVIEIQHAQRLEFIRGDVEEGAWREFVVTELTPSPAARLAGLVQLDADLRLRDQVERRRQQDRLALQAHVQSAGWSMRTAFLRWMQPQWERQIRVNLNAERKQVEPWRLQIFRGSAQSRVDMPDPSASAFLARVMTVVLAFWPLVWVVWAFLLRGGLSFRLLGLALVRGDGRPAARWQCAWRALLVWAPVVALVVGSVWLEQGYWSAWEAGAPSAWALWLAQLCGWAVWALLLAYVGLALRYPARGPHDRLAGTYLVPR